MERTAFARVGWEWTRRTVGMALLVGLLATFVIHAPAGGASEPGASAAKADPSIARAARSGRGIVPIIVRETAPASTRAESLVRSLHGRITHELPIIGGFSARVPADSLSRLSGSSSIARIWGDGRIRMLDVNMRRYDTVAPEMSWRSAVGLYRVDAYTNGNLNGAGVGVAVLDTGVYPNADLGNRLRYHASFAPDTDVYDHYGHGTHMAGIIAGDGSMSGGTYIGVATRASIISVKVAEPDGSTDVSVVIDGLQWIYSNKAQYRIRVVNLSFGTDGTQSYLLDPLDFAVEQVWKAGIFVAVAAGNRGPTAGTITKPGDDPFPVTVGATDVKNTQVHSDDVVADFSSNGPTQDGLVKPDVLAPGVGIVSARDPGSTLDNGHPNARVGDSYFKGSGTSQATAVVSGLAALAFQANPSLTPDQVKALILGSAHAMPQNVASGTTGPGMVWAPDILAPALRGAPVAPANQGLALSTGMGGLEGSRGSAHVYADLDGEGIDDDMVTGNLGWGGTSWGGTSWGGTSWGGTSWGGTSWGGTSWGGTSWGGTSWGGTSWGGTSWGGDNWG